MSDKRRKGRIPRVIGLIADPQPTLPKKVFAYPVYIYFADLHQRALEGYLADPYFWTGGQPGIVRVFQ